MRSIFTRLIAPIALLAALGPANALAQVNPYRVQQRYDNAKKGKSIDEWTKKLRDEDPSKRLEAVKSLGESDKPEAVEYLIEATGDPNEAVRIKAIDHLGRMRATAATSVLVQKLFMRDVDMAAKQRILVALGRMGDAKAAEPIGQFIGQTSDPAIAGTAIFALGEIGDQSVIPRLEHIQRTANDPHLSQLAGEAVAKINRRMSPSTVAVTVPALEEDKPPTAK